MLTSETDTAPAQTHEIVRFALQEADFAALVQSALLDVPATPPRGRNIMEIYFDTADFALAGVNLPLSLSKTRRGYAQRLQEAAAAVVAEAVPDLAAFPPPWDIQLPELLQDAALQPVFSLNFKRVVRQAGGADIWFEHGFIGLGSQKLKFCEIELRGPGARIYPLALALADKFPLLLQPASLAARGAWAAGAKPPTAVKAGPGLSGMPSLDEMVVLLTEGCLAQFTANWPVFALGDEVAAVHQMRVAMRRLRAVLGLFNREFFAAEFAAFRNEAKATATLLSEARNWDVFTALLRAGPAMAFAHEPGFAAIFAQCAAHREAGYTQARAMLADPATTRFLLAVKNFLARRGWRNGMSIEALPGLAAPARNFAAFNLARLHRKVRKRGKHIARLGAAQRHMVRIELKKLRYAAELFGGLFEGRGKVRAYNQGAAHLQEELGLLNDLAMAEELMARLDGGTLETARAMGIVLGWCGQAALSDSRKLSKSWKEFSGQKLFTG